MPLAAGVLGLSNSKCSGGTNILKNRGANADMLALCDSKLMRKNRSVFNTNIIVSIVQCIGC